MDTYTPLDVSKLDKQKTSISSTYLLLIANLGAIILVILLFLLIRSNFNG